MPVMREPIEPVIPDGAVVSWDTYNRLMEDFCGVANRWGNVDFPEADWRELTRNYDFKRSENPWWNSKRYASNA